MTTTLFDTPHPMIDQETAKQREHIARTCGIDFTGCNVTTIVQALNEYDVKALVDGKLSHSIETWPTDVKAAARRELEGFSARNGGAGIIATTMAIGGQPRAFILCLHWKPKS